MDFLDPHVSYSDKSKALIDSSSPPFDKGESSLMIVEVSKLYAPPPLVPHREKVTTHTCLGSPPPIIRSSISLPPIPSHPLLDASHSMAVDRISAALEEDPSEDGDSLEDDASVNSDDVVLDGKGLDDSITLVKYQEEILHDSLIQISSHEMVVCLKKGRLEPGGTSS